ncbi:MAG: hypothetical protein KJ621_13705 [Proteobacteria bacterium]|nr:hypothetical protein [Pseudomonadota bacterium]MBU1741506.1 hypothetical protein [Pseudomonadota bacterium]
MPDFVEIFEVAYWVASVLSDFSGAPQVIVLERGLNAVWVAFIGAGAVLVGACVTAYITGRSGKRDRRMQAATAQQMQQVQEATARQMQEAQLAVKMIDIKRAALEDWLFAINRLLWEFSKYTNSSKKAFNLADRNTLKEAFDQMAFAHAKVELFLNKEFVEMVSFISRAFGSSIAQHRLLIAGENEQIEFDSNYFKKLSGLYDYFVKKSRRDLKVKELGIQHLDTMERLSSVGRDEEE